MTEQPVAFMSYVRSEDQHENGRLTDFAARLSGEVEMQTGEAFPIFQDRNDIAWGQQWERRIEESLDTVSFLIPIITPGFLKSRPCRGELKLFLEREERLGRGDLILPVYYVNCPALGDEANLKSDPLAAIVASRQYADWRELRFEPFTSPQVGKTLARMATQIVAAMERGMVSAAAVPGGTRRSDPTPGSEAGQPSDQPGRRMHKTEPPTHIVDAFHRGDYATISAALEAAAPGDRILVRPGLYREGLVIDKPVEIIGDGELGEVVIEARGADAVLFAANMGRIANLTLRQVGDTEGFFGVDITQGRLDIEGCDITSRSLACVAIRGEADPRLRRNRIHDGKQGGVLVYDNGRGTLEGNEIFGNALAGVQIMDGGNPALRQNRIHDGERGGVLVYDGGQGTLESNEVFGNALAGVEITAGGNPVLRHNRIRDGKQGGIFVNDRGLGTLEDNEIFNNDYAGVSIATGGNPVLRGNRIHDGKADGVFVYDGGQGTLENNEIFGNALSGVQIESGGNPTLRQNRIHDGKQCGVLVNERGEGMLEDNDILSSADSGVEIRTGGNPTLRRNRISGGKGSGVDVRENGLGTFEDNAISGNAMAGVYISDGGNPTLRRNRISHNGYEAVWIQDKGRGTFEDNDLRSNTRGAWDIEPACLPNVKRSGNQE